MCPNLSRWCNRHSILISHKGRGGQTRTGKEEKDREEKRNEGKGEKGERKREGKQEKIISKL